MNRPYTPLIWHLLLFLLVCAHSTCSIVHTVYITPSPNIHCPHEPCPTLEQVASNPNSYFGFDINVTLSLSFLPGNHSLDRELSLSYTNVSMAKGTQGSGTVFIECGSRTGRFSISNATSAGIQDLHFIGCGGNSVSQVKQFVVIETIFQGVEDRGTALVLNGVTNSIIVRCSFVRNTYGSLIKHHDLPGNHGTFNHHSLKRNTNPPPTIGGALYTVYSHVTIVSSKFTLNSADFGGALCALYSHLHIIGSTYSYNKAKNSGVMFTSRSLVIIDNSIFSRNAAINYCGVVTTHNDLFSISGTMFTDNTAGDDIGVIGMEESLLCITNSTFTNNTAGRACGVIYVVQSSLNITSCICTNNSARFHSFMFTNDSSVTVTNNSFTNNSAADGTVLHTSLSSFYITSSTFTNNIGTDRYASVMLILNSSFTITNSIISNNIAYHLLQVMVVYNSKFSVNKTMFTNNSADFLEVMVATNSSFVITSSIFANNIALLLEIIVTNNSSFMITSSTFANNSVTHGGGVIIPSNSSFHIANCTFANNSATHGSVIYMYATKSSFFIDSSSFYANKPNNHRGKMFIQECSAHIANSNFSFSVGSLYIFNSRLTFSGHTSFEHCIEPSSKTMTLPHQGGAITSFRSTVIFTGVSSLSNNRARHGGAILATESRIIMYGETELVNNTAIYSSGGGICLYQSDLEVKGNCTISCNSAMRGGGIHAFGSTVAVSQPGTLQFINNRALAGGALYLEVNAKIYVLKADMSHTEKEYSLVFKDNHASYGGAVYVADNTSANACASGNECFIQTLTLTQNFYQYHSQMNTINIHFSGNTACDQGANIFGGLLDRCTPSPFAEVHINQPTHYSGVSYLGNISNITVLDTISSLPVRVCFCNSESEPNCSYQPPTIKVKKGEVFTVPLVAVDQVDHSVDADIISSLSSPGGGLSVGQQRQCVERNCTSLSFNVYSPYDSEILTLFADGPCGSSPCSTLHLHILFINCTCPIGFEPLNSSVTQCQCICDSKLFPYITNCNITSESLIRVNTNSWITYVNCTDPPGYVIHSNCPFDYCQPPTETVSINLNLPNGANAQCANNRSGVLCGVCKEHFSLSLGSSRCLSCRSTWPLTFVAILLAAIIAGILLVTVLLALNMTVTVGLIDGFIFYANIVAANSTTFFPSSQPSFPTMFIAWLNLDIGIDVCFFDGLDVYTKTWLQLAFPMYIIVLMIVVIKINEHFPRFAKLLRKRDPMSTLATLILLVYSKLLLVSITALMFTVLEYPDGSQEIVWLSDGTVKYFKGKHIALATIALMIIVVGVPYTILLLLWQCLNRAPRWKIFKWTRNTRLNAFVSVHHIPYNSKTHFWTGLLLVVRIVLYITASVTVSANPQISLFMTIVLVGGLLSLSKTVGVSVYKNLLVDIFDTIHYFNLLAISALSIYNFKVDIRKQMGVAFISTIITLILLFGAIIYHVFLLIRKNNATEETDEHPLLPADSETEIAEILESDDQSTIYGDHDGP